MKNKKIFSALLALALVLSSFAGCRAENKEETQEALMPSISTAATGRYVEREIPLPECQYAMDMVMLSNGKLRLALKEASGKIIFCTQGQKENTWETDFIPEASSYLRYLCFASIFHSASKPLPSHFLYRLQNSPNTVL